jgi:hypothetical protein
MEHDAEDGYIMGVYLCIGQPIYNAKQEDAIHIQTLLHFKAIHEHIEKHHKIFVFLGKGQHKIKRKAEQIACNEALNILNENII